MELAEVDLIALEDMFTSDRRIMVNYVEDMINYCEYVAILDWLGRLDDPDDM